MSSKDKSKSFPWAKVLLSILCGVLALVLVAGIFVTAFVESTLNKITRPPDNTDGPNIHYTGPNPTVNIIPNPTIHIIPDPTSSTDPSSGTAPSSPSGNTTPTVPPAPTIPWPTPPSVNIEHEDIVNIMLVGMDRRPDEVGNTRSDSMILCTVNTRNKTVTMTSFLRDMYVQIPGFGGNKLNAAYAIGGMKKLSATMKENFGINVDKFVTVDFTSFPKVIDILGGVDIPLHQDEVDYMSDYYSGLKVGMNHLDGDQALYYARIRYIGTDFERTRRQRTVLTAIMDSCRNISITQAMALINQFLPLVQTNMDNNTIMRYAIDFLPLLANGNLISQRIPLDGTWQNADIGDITWALWCDLPANQQFLYNSLMPN